MPPAPVDRFLTTKEVADRLGITPEYLGKLVAKGEGPKHYRFTDGGHLRFRWSEVKAWFEARSARQ